MLRYTQQINHYHAVGLSRGISCGDNYNCVEKVKDKKKYTKTDEGTYSKVEGKTTEKVVLDEAKTKRTKKSKTTK